jgi:uncharacterized protein YraI
VLHDQPDQDWLQWRPVAKLAAAMAPVMQTEGFSVEDLTPASYTVTTASHVRAGPDTTYPVLTTLSKGTSVPVTGKVQGQDWYRVEAGDTVGYVWAKLLEPATAAAQ